MTFRAVKNMGAGMVERHGSRPARTASEPAFTLRASAGDVEPGGFRLQFPGEAPRKLTVHEAAILQAFPPFPNERIHMNTDHATLDLFAGTGVGVALQRMGVKEYGVEIMPEAIATREANGMETVYNDVWDAHLAEGLEFDTLWASPPCQTFSMAGNGAGRRALDDVLGVISRKQYVDMTELREQSALLGDERIGLVLSPLHYAHRFRPTYLAFEQVPPVLPVWEAMAEELRELGYSVWTGLLHAEQYGVPQTRKRAILIARADGEEARPPVPTHSKYYSRDKDRLDPGVQKWVSMAEALGWAGALRSNYGSGGDPKARGIRLADQPAPTLTGKADRNKWMETGEALTAEEASALQTYPSTVFRNGNQANAAKRAVDTPAPTLMFGARSNKVEWMDADRAHDPAASGERVTVEEAAALQSYPTTAGWGYTNRSSPTVTGGGGKASGIELFDQAMRKRILADIDSGTFIPNGKPINPKTPLDPMRLQPDEAATLQTYPPFIWKGAKTKQFLQIGNAVPPLLAQAVLEATWAKAEAANPVIELFPAIDLDAAA